MAKEHSMDVVVQFDFQEIKNAVDQLEREVKTRFDLKDSSIEVELSPEKISIKAESDNQIESVYGILLKKVISRNQSPKILKRGKISEIGGMRVKEELELIKVLDSENAKYISKKIREEFSKSKASIQGESVRVSSKSIDDLQAIQKALLSDEEIKVPLSFTNYR